MTKQYGAAVPLLRCPPCEVIVVRSYQRLFALTTRSNGAIYEETRRYGDAKQPPPRVLCVRTCSAEQTRSSSEHAASVTPKQSCCRRYSQVYVLPGTPVPAACVRVRACSQPANDMQTMRPSVASAVAGIVVCAAVANAKIAQHACARGYHTRMLLCPRARSAASQRHAINGGIVCTKCSMAQTPAARSGASGDRTHQYAEYAFGNMLNESHAGLLMVNADEPARAAINAAGARRYWQHTFDASSATPPAPARTDQCAKPQTARNAQRVAPVHPRGIQTTYPATARTQVRTDEQRVQQNGVSAGGSCKTTKLLQPAWRKPNPRAETRMSVPNCKLKSNRAVTCRTVRRQRKNTVAVAGVQRYNTGAPRCAQACLSCRRNRQRNAAHNVAVITTVSCAVVAAGVDYSTV